MNEGNGYLDESQLCPHNHRLEVLPPQVISGMYRGVK